MKFNDLRLCEPILRAVADEGYTTATPIQARTIPATLDGRDVMGCAQTGTGKTAAFALPVLHRLSEAPPAKPQTPGEGESDKRKGHRKGKSRRGHDGDGDGRRARCLVLCPTRELASQIADSFATYGTNLPLSGCTIFGGVSQNPQVKNLRRGVDVIIATPGRLMDLMNQGHVDLGAIETLVLDEADRMLDMGFIHDIKRITKQVPSSRQTLMFSATMPPAIRKLAGDLLHNPETVQTARESPTAEGIDQSVYFVDRPHKTAMLAHLLDSLSITRAIVFTRTKHGADKVVRQLRKAGSDADAIHGNKSQAARERALSKFRAGRINVLVATDIASRGIDVDEVSHVFNYDLSHDPESYVHRIGRTARAGESGAAVSFCDVEERGHLDAIERLIQQKITVQSDHPESIPVGGGISAKPGRSGGKPKGRGGGGGGGGRRGKGKAWTRGASNPGGGGGGRRPRRGRASGYGQEGSRPRQPRGGRSKG